MSLVTEQLHYFVTKGEFSLDEMTNLCNLSLKKVEEYCNSIIAFIEQNNYYYREDIEYLYSYEHVLNLILEPFWERAFKKYKNSYCCIANCSKKASKADGILEFCDDHNWVYENQKSRHEKNTRLPVLLLVSDYYGYRHVLAAKYEMNIAFESIIRIALECKKMLNEVTRNLPYRDDDWIDEHLSEWEHQGMYKYDDEMWYDDEYYDENSYYYQSESLTCTSKSTTTRIFTDKNGKQIIETIVSNKHNWRKFTTTV